MKSVQYEVYADCIWGSDVLTADTLEEAYQKAKEWKDEQSDDTKIIITKVTTEIIDEL